MSQEAPDIETASDAYASRFAGPAGRYLLDRQARAVRAALEDWNGGSALDVGGGHAQLLPILTSAAEDVTVIGSSPASLGRVKKNFPDCRLVTGNLLELPFPPASFDLVVSVRLISHVDDWQRLVQELCRVARTAVIIDYPRSTGLNALTPLFFGVKKRIEGNTREYKNFSDRELEGIFRNHSFQVRKRIPQLLLPMVVHRKFNGARILQHFELVSTTMQITRALGSPVILRADRINGS